MKKTFIKTKNTLTTKAYLKAQSVKEKAKSIQLNEGGQKMVLGEKLTSKDAIETVKNSPKATIQGINQATKGIKELSVQPKHQITQEQKLSIEAATRKCIARMGKSKIPEEEIQRLLTKMYGMRDVKEAMDSLALNVSRVFGKDELKRELSECIKDIIMMI